MSFTNTSPLVLPTRARKVKMTTVASHGIETVFWLSGSTGFVKNSHCISANAGNKPSYLGSFREEQ